MDSIDVLNFTALGKRTFEDNGPTNKNIWTTFSNASWLLMNVWCSIKPIYEVGVLQIIMKQFNL